MNNLENVQPIYKEFKGWTGDISSASSYDELPENA